MSTEIPTMSDTAPETRLDTPPGHDTEVADVDAPPAAPARRTRRWTAALPWVITAVAVAVAAYSTWQWRELATYQADVDAVRSRAVAFATDLSNWDASDGLEDEIDTLREQGTGPFLDEIDLVFGGDELAPQLEANGVSATGEVEEAFVQEVTGTTAEVFTVVSVTYDAADSEGTTDPVTFPASLVLEKVDTQWFVREVTVPNTNQIGQLMAPSGGA